MSNKPSKLIEKRIDQQKKWIQGGDEQCIQELESRGRSLHHEPLIKIHDLDHQKIRAVDPAGFLSSWGVGIASLANA